MITPDSPAKWIALFFGAGCAPVAPGTFGTLAAIPVYLLLARLGPAGYAVATVLVIAVGAWASDAAARELGVHDHPAIVVDEVAGYLVTMAFLPVSWASVITGFVLFRLLDILKPWPIRWLDRHVAGGLGIMADDVVAALIANAATWGVLALLPV